MDDAFESQYLAEIKDDISRSERLEHWYVQHVK
jgi:hypothetical protein